MAARRSSRTRSNGGGTSRTSRTRRSSRASSSGSNPIPMVIGGCVVIVVILIAFATMGGDPPPANQEDTASTKEKEQPIVQPKLVSSKSSGGSKKSLKDPLTPAPAISDSVMTELAALYTKAKKQHDDARRALGASDNAKFNSLINDSWDTLKSLDDKIEPQLTWLEEADLDDWRVPRSYAGLERLIDRSSRLKGQVKRIKPNRR